jgi:Spy/CpxP family protein refolding chaperone
MRHLVVTVAGALALCLGLLATAGPAAADSAHRGRWSAHLQRRLNLTDDQMTTIRQAFQRHAEERRQLGQALRIAQTDLRQLALTGGPEDAVRAKTAEVQQLLGQSVALRVKVLQEIAPSLTQEQREKMSQMGFPGGHRHHKRRAPAGTGT